MPELIVTLTKQEDLSFFQQADGYLIGNHDTAVRIAQSFSLVEMETIIQKARTLKKKIYLNFNKIFTQQELKGLENNFSKIIALDFDGIFFSDFAIFVLAEKANQVNKLIYASETQIVNYHDIHAFSQAGITTFIVSKEMTYDNILLTASQSKVTIGMLAFGHYNMFYSKRKLVANFVEEFKLNNFDFENKMDLVIQEKTRQERLPIIQNNNGANIFSRDIMCAIEEFLPLVKQGVKLFVFDTIFLDPSVTNHALRLFKQSVIEQKKFTLANVQEATNLSYLSKGFLFKDVGLK